MSDGHSQECPLNTSQAKIDSEAQVDPAKYQLKDEPVAADSPVDYRYQFALMEARMKYEEERRRNIDTKTATVIAGIIASLSLSLRVNSSFVACVAAALLLVPLWTLFQEFLTAPSREAPSAESIVKYFEAYPVSFLKASIEAMMEALVDNRKIVNRKANLLDRGIQQTIFCLAVILLVQLGIAVYEGNYFGKLETVSTSDGKGSNFGKNESAVPKTSQRTTAHPRETVPPTAKRRYVTNSKQD